MKALVSIASTCMAAAFSGLAFAQTTETYFDGLLSQAMGGATLGAPAERRLPVNNIGSSGQDGVEIKLRTTSGGGGGVGVEMPYGLAGGEIKIRHKGWDGLIYHRAQMTSNSDGSVTTIVDLTDLGAIALRTRTYDATGHVLSDVTTDGGMLGFLDYPDCPPPGVPTLWVTKQGWVVWGCGVGLDPHGNPYPYARTVQPMLPPGTPWIGDLDSIQITGSNLAEMGVVDASIGTFGVDSWGLGQAHISEVPNDPGTPGVSLACDNLGHSGQDGVAIDLGPSLGSSSLRSKKCPDCPPGHVTLIKFYDDLARVVQQAHTSADPASGGEFVDMDFSGLGATDIEVTLLDENGGTAARYPVGGLAFGGWMSGMCPPNCSEIWEQNWYSGTWTFVRCDCLSGYDFFSNTGIYVTNVHSIIVKPLGVTSPTVRQVELTSDDETRTLVIQDVSTHTRCPGDLNADDAVTLNDLAILLGNYGKTGATPGQGDLDGDMVVSLTDVAIVLSLYGKTCP